MHGEYVDVLLLPLDGGQGGCALLELCGRPRWGSRLSMMARRAGAAVGFQQENLLMKLVGYGLRGGVEGDYRASSAGFRGQEREDVGVGHGLVTMKGFVGGFF